MSTPKALTLAILMVVANISIAETPSDSAVGSNLPPKIRALLIQEMVEILDASNKILAALVRGQDEIVAEQGQAIHDSFIMKRALKEEDRTVLHNTLPDAFIVKDRAFHKLGASLAEAARDGDKALQMELFSDLVEACRGCHSAHAVDRFPGFVDAE